MVKVTKHTVRVETVTLELDAEMAQFLADVCGSIGGHPATSRRKFSDALANALREVGFKNQGLKTNDSNGSIMFKDVVT